MSRAFLFVLDSFGIGGSTDAHLFGDEGANTYGHIMEACARGGGDRAGLRSGPLDVPVMRSLGLGHAAATASGISACEPPAALQPGSFHAAAQEISTGKDTPSGHWEIAAVPVLFDWGYFPDTTPTFPAALTAAVIRQGRCRAFSEIATRRGLK